MARFREQRGGLAESLETTVEVFSLAELKGYCRVMVMGSEACVDNLTVKRYAYDDRIGWDTYIVELKNFGVLGFTDGPLS